MFKFSYIQTSINFNERKEREDPCMVSYINQQVQVCIKNIKDDRNKFLCHIDMIREVTTPEIYKRSLSKCLKNFQQNTCSIFSNNKKLKQI